MSGTTQLLEATSTIFSCLPEMTRLSLLHWHRSGFYPPRWRRPCTTHSPLRCTPSPQGCRTSALPHLWQRSPERFRDPWGKCQTHTRTHTSHAASEPSQKIRRSMKTSGSWPRLSTGGEVGQLDRALPLMLCQSCSNFFQFGTTQRYVEGIFLKQRLVDAKTSDLRFFGRGP